MRKEHAQIEIMSVQIEPFELGFHRTLPSLSVYMGKWDGKEGWGGQGGGRGGWGVVGSCEEKERDKVGWG